MDELRKIIYRERTDLDSFLEEHQLWEDLYDEYYVEMHAKSQENDAWCGPFALHDFNRAYYYCHLVLLDPHPENDFNRKFIVYKNYSQPIYARSTLIAYIILSLSNHRNERSVKRFLKAAGPLLEAYEGFQSAKSFVRDNKDKYDFSIKITPTSAEELEKKYGEGLRDFWYSLLDSIDTPDDGKQFLQNPPGKYYTVVTIEKIISLYKSKKQKLKIIEQMSEAANSEIWGLNFDITLTNLQAELEKMPDAEEACAPAELPANAKTNTPSNQEGVISITPQKEEKIKNAIKMLLAEKFGDSKIKFKSSNWFVVYKVYETHYQNGIDYVTFSNLMKQWQLTEKDIDNNISKATQTEDVKNLPNRISEWRDYRDKVNAAAKRHIDVALKFLELLR